MKTKADASIVAMEPLLLRKRDVAAAYSVSESLVAMFVRRGWLTPVRIPGVRATRFALEDVKALARRIQTGELNDERPERGLATGRSVRGEKDREQARSPGLKNMSAEPLATAGARSDGGHEDGTSQYHKSVATPGGSENSIIN